MGASSLSQRGRALTPIVCVLLLILLAFLGPASAAAQPSTSSTAMARAFFEQGLELAEAEEWEQAADRFQRSLRLRRSPVVAFNLGTAYGHLGRLVEAAELFRGAARDGGGDLAAAARAQLAEVEPRLGTLTVHTVGPEGSVQIQIDGRPLSLEAIGAPIPADPGTRTLRALRGDDEVASAIVEVTAGATAEVTLRIPTPEVSSPEEVAAQATAAEPRLATSTRPVAAAESGGDDTLVWVVIIAAIAVAAGVGVGLGVGLSQGVAEPIGGNLTPGTLEFGR